MTLYFRRQTFLVLSVLSAVVLCKLEVENTELERESDDVAGQLLEAFWQATGIVPREPMQIQAHRWKYAIPVDPPNERCFFDVAHGIVACGDWAGGPRVEGAFLSGLAAAGRLLGSVC